MRYFILLFTLLLTACGGGDSDSPAPQAEKLAHPGIQIQELVQTYAPDQRLTPAITGKLGSISYQLVNGAPTDVVKISADKQYLTILNAGSTELIATDSGNSQTKPVSQRFSISINKAPRTPLLTNDISQGYVAGAQLSPSISGVKGSLSLMLAEGQPANVVTVDAQGKITVLGTGSVKLLAKDDGGRNFQADSREFQVNISPAETAYATYQNIAGKPLIFGGKLLPVYSGTPTTEAHYQLVAGANTQVVQVHPTTGAMNILGAGETQVEVQQVAPANHTQVPVQRFSVQVDKAQNLAFKASDVTTRFDADKTASFDVTGVQGKLRYAIKAGAAEDVISITDAELGEFSFQGVGETEVEVTDTGNHNYLSTSRTIKVKVEAMIASSLQAIDINTQYQTNQTLTPQVVGAKGSLSYNLTASSATDVVTLDTKTGQMQVLKPGTVAVIVKDDGGELWTAQEKQFSVTIDKQDNSLFVVENSRVDFAANAPFVPQPSHNQGQVSYQVDNGGDGVLSQDAGTKAITIVGAGRGWITATDAGNDFYHPASSRFFVDVAPLNGSLQISSVRSQYAPGKTLTIPMSGAIGSLSLALKSGQDDVVGVDLANKTLTVKNAGSVTYIVTDSGDAGHLSQKAELNVVIDKGAENPELALSSTLVSSAYSPDASLKAPGVSGRGIDSEISYYTDTASSKVVSLNDTTGEMTVLAAGMAKVTVIEQSRNYERTLRDFNVSVAKAVHPGLSLDEISQSVVYYPDRKVLPPEFTNAFGKLTYAFGLQVSPEYAELTSTGELTLHAYPRSGDNDYFDIIVTDDGGNNYQSTSLNYKVFLKDIEPGLGEEASLTFDGSELQLVSPADVASGDVSYFTAIGGRGDALSKDGDDELDGGYTNMVTQVCTDPDNYKGCTLITLRLQNTSLCSDGSRVAYPIASDSRYTCPGMSQPVSSEVSVSMHSDDPYNAWFVNPGRFKTLKPIVVTHFAKPYRSGDVVEAGDIQARAWWLINLDITKK
ncbi:hypothetical protein [Shewanella halotolerans]|uniref:hypothetical protein n=1 Tax=Shewanella halotolerans TaxID=2864204 RepID=UPI001C65501F|nr:hypothetical protein [Shewanella halotolerans]QYJ89592.1 hypothetical protein K0H81_17770 [Shewanella halotolerans]